MASDLDAGGARPAPAGARPDGLALLTPPVLIGTALGLAFLLPLPVLVRFFPDDAFFYLKTARHLSQGLGSTFDGVNLTNGYHPLYMGLLVCLSWLCPLVGGPGVRAVFLLDMLLVLLGLTVIDRWLRRMQFQPLSRALIVLVLLGPVACRDLGMEVRLLFPLAWTYIAAVTGLDGRRSWRRALGTGALGALVCLTRPDAVLLILVLSLQATLARARTVALPERLNRLALLTIPALAGLGLLGLYNERLFSRPMPVSGWLKTGWPSLSALWPRVQALARYDQYWLAFTAFCLGTSLLQWAATRAGRGAAESGNRVRLLTALSGFNLLYLLVMNLFYRTGMPSWCFALPLSISLVCAAHLFERWLYEPWLGAGPVRRRRAIAGLLVVVAACVPLSFVPWTVARNPRDDALGFAESVRAHLPPDARVYQVDGCGVVGYFSERAIINGDGLVNSWEYQDYLRGNALPAYLRRYGVGYIAWDGYRGEEPIRIPVPLWNQPPQILTFSRPPARVARVARFVLLQPAPGSVVVAPLRPTPPAPEPR